MFLVETVECLLGQLNVNMRIQYHVEHKILEYYTSFNNDYEMWYVGQRKMIAFGTLNLP